MNKGTKVRLNHSVWLPEWNGLTGTVISDRSSHGYFIVQVDNPPASAIYGGEVIVHQDDQVEEIA
jgi:hypothetical protein